MLTSLTLSSASLTAFSKELATISNNVANLNTIGFKSSTLQFAAQFSEGRSGGGSGGNNVVVGGVSTVGAVVDFQAGDFLTTENKLNLAVDGAGFFILKDEHGHVSYTKNGDFKLEGGFLISQEGKRVQGLTPQGTLEDISQAELQSNPASATTKVDYAVNATLSTALTGAQPASTPSFTVYDKNGGTSELSITYTNLNPPTGGGHTHDPTKNTWKVEIKRGTTTINAPGYVLEFDVMTGRPKSTHMSYTFDYDPGGHTALRMPITLNFQNLASNSAGSGTSVSAKPDGYGVGRVNTSVFDAEGNFVISYTNGQNIKAYKIALARFESSDGLVQTNGGTFLHTSDDPVQLGTAGGLFGKLKLEQLERSNVDLSREFSKIIVTQRAYQASTELASTANEMLGNLLQMAGR